MSKGSLLVIAPSPGIGDFIVRIPAVKLLARYYSVTLICPLPENMRPFAEECLAENSVDLVLASARYRKSKAGILLGHLEDTYHAVKHRRRATACVVMSDSNSLFGIAKYSLISLLVSKSTRRFAFLPARGRFPFHENVAVGSEFQKMVRFFEFSKLVLSALNRPCNVEWDDDLPALRELPPTPCVVLAPGGKFKRQWWPYFDVLAKMLQEQDVRTIVVGAIDERDLISKVRQSGQEMLIGEDLISVTRVLDQATVLVCNDSGLLHLAVWRGVRAIAICGPRFAATWTGYPTNRVVQLYEGRAAFTNEAENSEYRIQCLANIAAERVVAEVRRILG